MYARGRQRAARYLDRYRGPLGDVVLAAFGVGVVLRLGTTPVHIGTALLAVACAVLILLRRWRPVPVLLAGTAVFMLTTALGRPPDGMFIVAGVLAYSTALYGERRRPWFHAGLVWGALMVTGTVVYGTGWWNTEQFTTFAIVFGGAAAGDAVRMRRAYIAEVTERARQAEATREEEARRRVMDERLRIARELHDVVAHHIAVISVHAGAAGHALRDDPERVWPVLGHIRSAADTVLTELKSVISVLRDPDETRSAEPAPGVDRLPDLLAGLASVGFAVHHRQYGTPRPLPAVVSLAAYRIVQEALTNAHRHGDGSASLDVEYTADTVRIEVVNRVVWSGSRRPGSGFGLIGMRERAAAAHGTITTGPVAGGGFRVYAELPTDDRAVDRLHPPVDPAGVAVGPAAEVAVGPAAEVSAGPAAEVSAGPAAVADSRRGENVT
ncbi:sensor histidine kinase [Solwaraspora sp. WMMD791]|uniref:sensor histidine kinase n=1 Tax=Solwaraspora sp. WMMD791 TaxID=3016086 RepID=UPI00249B61D9|nr:sensor histidine kinase [Solwaraspora sp. WMMD791]WFE26947.1 sensor histidine kinase [Solwaraspora sp. WMMD791]